MRIRRKKAFRQLFQLIRAVEAHQEDLASVRKINLLALKEVLRAEQAVLRHREAQRKLNSQLKTGRGSRELSRAIRGKLKRVARYIEAQEDQIFVWKCFGDALAYSYLDKFSIKHAFFETDRRGTKSAAGMISGKKGLPQETTFLLAAIDHGVPAVLCDITNILRYGDVCLLGRSDPFLFEVKSSPKLNQRGKRQMATLQKLHRFLSTDRASDFRGGKGTTKRVNLGVPERNHIDTLNDCIARAKLDGQCVVRPEHGVTYVAIYGKPDFDAILSNGAGNALMVFILNGDKNDHAWAPYTPFVLSIRDEVHLLDFIEGRLFLIVLIDAQVLCDIMSSDEWAVRYRPDHEYAIQCLHRPTKSYFGVSGQFLARAGYEFSSLAWIAEAHEPSQRLRDIADDTSDAVDITAQERALVDLFGPDDDWIR